MRNVLDAIQDKYLKIGILFSFFGIPELVLNPGICVIESVFVDPLAKMIKLI